MDRIVIFSSGSFQPYGHAYDYSKGLAESFVKQGFEVYIFGISGPLEFPSPIIEKKIDLNWKTKNQITFLNKIYWSYRKVTRGKILIEECISFLNEFDEPPLLLFETFEYFSLARKLSRIKAKYSCIFHDTNFNFQQTSVMAGIYKYFARIPARKIVKHSVRTYVHGDKMRTNFLDHIGHSLSNKVETIPYGAPEPHVPQKEDVTSAREHLSLNPEKYYILSFGTLRSDKEYLPIVEALANTSNWHWIIAGPEGDVSYEHIKKIASRYNVDGKLKCFPRFIRNQEQYTYFNACNLVINLYKPFIRHESGTAQLARTYAKPVIVSGPPDLTDYVAQNSIGYVISNEEELTNALNHYEALDEESLNQRINNILEFAKARSWPSISHRIAMDLSQAK